MPPAFFAALAVALEGRKIYCVGAKESDLYTRQEKLSGIAPNSVQLVIVASTKPEPDAAIRICKTYGSAVKILVFPSSDDFISKLKSSGLPVDETGTEFNKKFYPVPSGFDMNVLLVP
jgi:hypothetical protein